MARPPELLDEEQRAQRTGGNAFGQKGRGQPLIRLEGVTKRFGPLLANDDVSFDIPADRVIGLLGENGAWAIGSESDMTSFAPERYLTGTIWDWCPFYVQAVEMVKNGSFKPGEFYGGLDDGTVSLAPLHDAVPDDIKAMVEEKRQALIDGSFDYWTGPLQDNDGKEVVAAGQTLSIADINGMGWLVDGVVGRIPNR